MATTMTNPYAVPTTIDDTVLTTSLADYQKRLVDNVYNNSTILKLLGQGKRTINGGTSIG
jgi:hypothetical protein